MNPISQSRGILAGVLLVALSVNTATAAGDAVIGKKIFKKCSGCHKIGDGAKNSIGPVLAGVVGRAAGSYPGYSYGKSMRKAAEQGLVWNEENINEWLKSPKKFLRKFLDSRKAKAKMRFKLKKSADRENVIAFLKTQLAMNPEAATPIKASVGTAARPAMPFSATDVCVENQSEKTLLFVVEAKGGKRVVGTLSANENLCAPQAMADAGGTVGVFQNAEALEGCSRLAKAGKAERLIKYEPFDNCSWAQ